MSQQSVSRTPQSQSLSYSWNKPLTLHWYREAVFDSIRHGQAFSCININIGATPVPIWLHYFQAPVLLPEQCDALYGVEPRTTDRLIRYFGEELRNDGKFLCPETFAVEAEKILGLCWIGVPSTNFLLPPRAVLRLACFMPATTEVLRVLTCLDAITNKIYQPLPEPARMSQHYRVMERRTAPKDKVAMIAEAKELGLYAHAKHFGDLKAGVTYQRLLTHYKRGGQFPPTRMELNDLLIEF